MKFTIKNEELTILNGSTSVNFPKYTSQLTGQIKMRKALAQKSLVNFQIYFLNMRLRVIIFQ